jgi:hypothetical protein
MLDALGNLGDFIGGIAVIVTLIYLATQVRLHTAALRAASRQDISAGYRAQKRSSYRPSSIRGLLGWPPPLSGYAERAEADFRARDQ